MSDNTPRLTMPYIQASQSQKEVTHNEALNLLDALVQGVIQARQTAPPATPVEGAVYIVTATATGAWAGKENYVAQYIGAAWVFYAPFEGMKFYSVADANDYQYKGAEWTLFQAGSSASSSGNYFGDESDGSKTYAATTYLGHAMISKYAVASNVVTITTAAAHGFTTGNLISIQQCTLSALNNTVPPLTGAISAGTHHYSITVTGATTFTFSKTNADVAETAEVNADATCCKWDGPAIVKNYTDLTIDNGATVTPAARCKGLVVYATGNVTINGTLTMTRRGAAAAGDDCSLQLFSPYVLDANNRVINTFAIPAAGANGATALTASSGGSVTGVSGAAGTNGQTGGGGAGAAYGGGGSVVAGNGAAGTSYSGGSAGSGANQSGNNGEAGAANGGKGGDSKYDGGSAGAGNPAGAATYGTAAQNGTGGLLIAFVKGDLDIGATGLVSADGADGGGGTTSGGGATGGGSVNLFYAGAYTNSGTVRANGGTGGSGGAGRNGGNGGAGTARAAKIAA